MRSEGEPGVLYGLLGCTKESGVYSEGDGKSLESFKQGNSMS